MFHWMFVIGTFSVLFFKFVVMTAAVTVTFMLAMTAMTAMTPMAAVTKHVDCNKKNKY